MYFEEVLPYLRKGRKVRRKGHKQIFMLKPEYPSLIDEEGAEYCLDDSSTFDSVFFCDDWEVVLEVRKVADYLTPQEPKVICGTWTPFNYFRVTKTVGTELPGDVLIPGTEREEEH